MWSMSLSTWSHFPISQLQFQKQLEILEENGKAILHIDMPIYSLSTKEIIGTVNPRIGFSCIDSSNILQEVKWLSEPGSMKCPDSKQALMVVGSPIGGYHPFDMEDGAIEAAHFSFRALTGKLKVSSVYLGFLTNETRSIMVHECGGFMNRACVHSRIANNVRVMQHYKGKWNMNWIHRVCHKF